MTIKPPLKKRIYNQEIGGFFGTFGTGADCQIFFLQVGLRPTELDRLTLISDIPGAETWSVQDLFQREVDSDRVTHSLIPYLKDRAKVKFFNPLTLTLLPFDPISNQLLPNLHELQVKEEVIDEATWQCLELEGFFRFRHVKDALEYGVVEWNDTKVRIVAIDGQHRLSALKRLHNDTPEGRGIEDFESWIVPAVLFSARALSDKAEHERILDIVRNIFVYINTEAKKPSETREILLSDGSVNNICTQELLQYSHENDVLPASGRDRHRTPLICFDWRGLEQGGREVTSPAALKKATEIRDWLRFYIIGEDFSDQQEAAFDIEVTSPLKKAFREEHLGPKDVARMRELFRATVLPGLATVLQEFAPYRTYIRKLRDLEDDYNGKSDLARHAFHKLRFGDCKVPENLIGDVKEIEHEIIQDITDLKQELPDLIWMDIGMRGIVSAFGQLRELYQKNHLEYFSWKNYAEWFVEGLNLAFQDDWLKDSNQHKWKLLHQITRDHNDNVANYRLQDVPSALGSLVALLVPAYQAGQGKYPSSDGHWGEIWEEFSDTLYDTLFRGFKKECRSDLRDKYPMGGRPLTEAAKECGAERASKHLASIQRILERTREG